MPVFPGGSACGSPVFHSWHSRRRRDCSFGEKIEGGWDSVDDTTRRHQAWDVPADMFRDWGADLRGSGDARL